MDSEGQFKNGHWKWDDEDNTLQFISHDLLPQDSDFEIGVVKRSIQGTQTFVINSIRFKDSLDTTEKQNFRRHYQRRPEIDPDVITMQDIKDVALYLANRKDLSAEFITYFHLPEIDKFLRAIVIYFHFYLQTWDNMMLRRTEARRKLRQPIVTELENIRMQDLADLRSMVAREYCSIILGIGKCVKFHHLSGSTTSLADKERRLFESLVCMTVRVIWIALQRRHLGLIELEVNKMLRTDYFNIIAHRGKQHRKLWRSNAEERILIGMAIKHESKLNQRSAVTKEMLYGEHDHRMMGAGLKHFEPISERSEYLERLFAAPYESLLQYGITIGLCGIPREDYDCIMMPRERTEENFDKIIIEPIDIKLPPRADIPGQDMPKTYPREDSKYQESPSIHKTRKEQCSIWRTFVLAKKFKPRKMTTCISIGDLI